VIVDREGMAAPFLRDLKALGHTVVTILRTDQYEGLESFTEVGMFVPLERDRQGQLVTRPSLRPVSLSHCLTRKVSSFLYVWPSFVICAVTFRVFGKTKKRMKMFGNPPGGKRIGKRNRHLPVQPPPS